MNRNKVFLNLQKHVYDNEILNRNPGYISCRIAIQRFKLLFFRISIEEFSAVHYSGWVQGPSLCCVFVVLLSVVSLSLSLSLSLSVSVCVCVFTRFRFPHYVDKKDFNIVWVFCVIHTSEA